MEPMVALRAPATIETARLILRKPVTGDAEAVFAAYASDAAVTRHLGWPRHQGTLRHHSEFPNLEVGVPRDVLCYAAVLARSDIV